MQLTRQEGCSGSCCKNIMKRIPLLWRIMKRTGFLHVFASYMIFFLILALVFYIREPGVESYGNGIWYCFVASTTIGFGDVVAVTTLGRALTMILTVYSIAVTAMFTAVIANYFMNIIQMRANDSAEAFLYQLEHLPELSKEELEELSKKVKARRDSKL